MMEKIYRCGWCGLPVQKDGDMLEDTTKGQTQMDGLSAGLYDEKDIEQVNGDCCRDTLEARHTVTRDMAIDAQDPNLEGTEY